MLEQRVGREKQVTDQNPELSTGTATPEIVSDDPVLLAANTKTSPTWTSPLAFVAAGDEVSVTHQGLMLARSRDVIIVHEQGHTPVFYFPREDVQFSTFTLIDRTSHCPRKGDASYYEAKGTNGVPEGAVIAWSYEDPIPMASILKNYFAFYPDNIELSRKA